MSERGRAAWLGLAAGVVQSLDFLRERTGAFDAVPGSVAAPVVIAATLSLWTLAGLRAADPRSGARAGLLSAAVTALALWGTTLLSGNASIGYACWHAAAFLPFGALCAALPPRCHKGPRADERPAAGAG
ncbi:hypothetical protein ACFV4F_22775 [Kitasatospora sp. NPDC059722]|uniref:hypothetical protein n=1 Tax=Kitasatospora sp. NPDC059722 TaxID=3346925 RepID=UPI00368926B6